LVIADTAPGDGDGDGHAVQPCGALHYDGCSTLEERSMRDWMIYGANGYTGELIAREAARRGHRPVLAGRRAEKIEPLARELGLSARVFPLSEPRRAVEGLSGIAAALHCAGPFVRTSRPMVEACLEAGAHYLDITGEISVFESIMARTAEARRREVVLLPGVGFDVVPTDCLAAMLSKRLPDASDLILAFYTRGGVSRGTLKTMIEGMGEGGAVRRDGRIVRVPMLHDVREIPFSVGPRMAMTIPWGDVATAWHTTGIPNIRIYSASSPKAIARVRRMMWLLPLLSLRPVKRLLQTLADRRRGPDEHARATGRVYLWGRVANRAGSEATMTMTTPEGYAFTIMSALAAVERLLADPARPGSFTPAGYLGADFVTSIPGVVVD
jgi:short subunit dehydrogenase-like uncharacterized protein